MRSLYAAVAVLVAVTAAVAVTVESPLPLQRHRLTVAEAGERETRRARKLAPAAGEARLVFVWSAPSKRSTPGVEIRFPERSALLLAPRTFSYKDVVPGVHAILARSVWGLVQSITFTKDHGSDRPFQPQAALAGGTCCPPAVVLGLTPIWQKLTVFNWEAHLGLWRQPDYLAEDPRTHEMVSSYQNDSVPSRWVEMEIAADAGDIFFFRVAATPEGEVVVSSMDADKGRAWVEELPLSAVRMRVVRENVFTLADGFPLDDAPVTTQGIMANGLLDPLVPPGESVDGPVDAARPEAGGDEDADDEGAGRASVSGDVAQQTAVAVEVL